jgi:hypothetical protein
VWGSRHCDKGSKDQVIFAKQDIESIQKQNKPKVIVLQLSQR